MNRLPSNIETNVQVFIEPLKETISKGLEKTGQLASKCLTPKFLHTKTLNAINAKLHPLSVSKELQKKTDKNSQDISRLRRLKSICKIEISEIDSMCVSGNSPPKSLLDKKAAKQAIHNQVNEKLQEQLILEEHLEKARYSQIFSRLAWYADKMIGVPVSYVVSGIGTYVQEKSAKELPKNLEFKKERQEVRSNTWITVGLTVTSLAIGYFALPAIKTFIMESATALIS